MHLKKRMTFHGVDYAIIPEDMWDEAVACVAVCEGNFDTTNQHFYGELMRQIEAYEGMNEEESDDE